MAFEKNLEVLLRAMSEEACGRVSLATPDIQAFATALREEIQTQIFEVGRDDSSHSRRHDHPHSESRIDHRFRFLRTSTRHSQSFNGRQRVLPESDSTKRGSPAPGTA